jgi:hypothetical protein
MIKENICSYHNDIKLLAQKLKRLRPDDYTTIKELQQLILEIKQYGTEIYDTVALAKTAGIHMENRLRVYSDGVTAMGFIRKKRKKYEKKDKKKEKEEV